MCYANCKYEYGMGECVGECKFRDKNQIPGDALCAQNVPEVQTCPGMEDLDQFINKPKKKGRFRILELT